jgi:prepilin-type N-terminal cleavage/methylation domain-containing protein
MRKRNEKGFTLIEVVVVVAVIAILAAVLTPYITKYIDDSKIAKARNEVQVIAAAVTNAYKDLGRWPNRINAATDYGGLYTGATTPAAAFFGAATGWTAAGAGWNSLDTHLVTNGHTYPATGDTKWAGPYATTLPVDPWGRPYVINAANFQTQPLPPAAPIPVWVLSSGPNGVVNTNIANTPAAAVTGGDDIGFRVR